MIRSFHGDLVDHAGNPVPGLPAAMARYLEEAAKPPEWVDPAKLEIAESILNSHGILVFLLLACASLPECYVDRLGMPVLFLTQKLNKDITRRVVEGAGAVGHRPLPGEAPRTLQGHARAGPEALADNWAVTSLDKLPD